MVGLGKQNNIPNNWACKNHYGANFSLAVNIFKWETCFNVTIHQLNLIPFMNHSYWENVNFVVRRLTKNLKRKLFKIHG